MAAFRKPKAVPPERPKAIVGSAMEFTFGGAQTWQTIVAGDRRWQAEAWYQFDICGEMRYATGWKGNACSQATLFAADVDPLTGRPTGPTDNPTVQKITDSILGGPVKRPQHVRTICLNLEVAGEVYVIALAQRTGTADEWLVISGTELNMNGGGVEFVHPKLGTVVKLGQQDLMIRIWTPHPRLQLNADSAVRALLPVLREIENTSRNIAARLDSRLAGAGILVLPDTIDFPDDDSDPEGPTGFTGMLTRSMRASLQEPGSAAAQVPITIEVPVDAMANIKHLTLETPLSKEVVELRDSGISRLAAGLDLPREVLEGMGASNHWSAWQVAEETYKTHLLPLLDTISDALTVAYLIPALEAAKVAQPEQYMLAFDGSTLIGEPDPLTEALELFDRGIISDVAVRTLTSTPEEFAPQGEERLRALAERLVTAAPTLFAEPELRRRLGFTEAPSVPAEPVAITDGAAAAPAVPEGDGPPSRTASFTAASLLVQYALERVGNKMLNTQRLRDEFSTIPRHELHTKIKPDPERHGDLLDNAWRHAPNIAVTFDLDRYTRALIATGAPHTDDNLTEWLDRRG